MADKNKQADTSDLASIRKRIDDIDERIQALINERARFAQEVGISKGVGTSAADYYRPEREAQADNNGKVPLETSGADILGLTSTEKVQAALCDWVEPGSGSVVFPSAIDADEESPDLLSGLLPA